MEESFEAAVKQAFHQANVNHDCEFDFKKKTTVVAALEIAQCIVSYKKGNEYIRLDTLLSSLEAYGAIELVELRGRGAKDQSQILIEMKCQGVAHQIIYLLP